MRYKRRRVAQANFVALMRDPFLFHHSTLTTP
jgi:hypothetical protein